MRTVKPTPSQSLARCLAVREIEPDVPFIAGVWAIFGHGNVAGPGEALQAAGDRLPTWRDHNERSMALSAVAFAFAKASDRRQAAVPHPARHPALPRSIRASRDAAMTGSTPSDPAPARSAA